MLDAGHKPTDEEKYRSMVRSHDQFIRWNNLRNRHTFPTPLDKALATLESQSLDRHHKQQQELVASGYLVSFRLTNDFPEIFDLVERPVTNCAVTLYVETNDLFLACRPKDVARIRAIIEKNP